MLSVSLRISKMSVCVFPSLKLILKTVDDLSFFVALLNGLPEAIVLHCVCGLKKILKMYSCPGEKLQALKAKLQEAMKLRRTEERQKRQALFKLDNEEMEEEEEEEEEEEMTDESDEEEEQQEGSLEVCFLHFFCLLQQIFEFC